MGEMGKEETVKNVGKNAKRRSETFEKGQKLWKNLEKCIKTFEKKQKIKKEDRGQNSGVRMKKLPKLAGVLGA